MTDKLMICPKVKECAIPACLHDMPHEFRNCYQKYLEDCPACVLYVPEKSNNLYNHNKDCHCVFCAKPQGQLVWIPDAMIIETRHPHNATCFDCQQKMKPVDKEWIEGLAEKIALKIYQLNSSESRLDYFSKPIKQAIEEYMEELK